MMESNGNGRVDLRAEEVFSSDENLHGHWVPPQNYPGATQTYQQQYRSSHMDDQPFTSTFNSSFPSYNGHPSYGPDATRSQYTPTQYQQAYPNQNPDPYYQHNQRDFTSYPPNSYQPTLNTQDSFQTTNSNAHSQFAHQGQPFLSHSSSFASQPTQPYNHTSANYISHQPPSIPANYGNVMGQPTSSFPSQSPMERMAQLAKKQYGGPLAAQTAAVAAGLAPRRNSPPSKGPRREGAEETVKDVLQRQYKMQQMKQQSHSTQGFPNTPSFPPTALIPPPVFTPTPQSVFGSAPTPLSSTPLLLDSSPSTPSTPIFSFPLVAPRTPFTPSPRPDSTPDSAPSVIVLSGPPSPDSPSTGRQGTSSDESATGHEPLRRTDNDDAQKAAMFTSVRKRSLIQAIRRANTISAETSTTIDEMTAAVVHQAATVVQTLHAPTQQSLPSTSRKRALPPSRSPPLKGGEREEINENGERVKKVYVLLHHCNKADPDYDPRGVLKTLEEIELERKRDDLFTLSFTSAICPYEQCDFRFKRRDDFPMRPLKPLPGEISYLPSTSASAK